jgi:tetratricopeptide (TPR) repeat protein
MHPDHHSTLAGFEQLLDRDPDAAVARLAELFERASGQGTKDDDLLADLLECREATLRFAEFLLDEGRTAAALEWCARLLERKPGHRGALVLESLIEIGEHDGGSALAACDRLVAAHPYDPGVHLHRGMVRLAVLSQSRQDRDGALVGADSGLALADFNMAARMAPDEAEVQLARGRALASMGLLDEALAAYDDGLGRDPSLYNGYVERAHLWLRQAEYERAVQDCNVVLDRLSEARASNHSLLAEAHLERARALGALGEFDAAVNDYAAAVRLAPEMIEAYLEQGLLHNEQGWYVQAKQAFELVYLLDPGNAAALGGLGDAHLALGLNRPAASNYLNALELEPKNAAAHLGRATALLRVGRLDRWRRNFDDADEEFRGAVSHGDEAVRLDPDNPWAYGELGRAFRALVAYDQAAAEFERACQLAEAPAVLAVLLGERAETLRLWGALVADETRMRLALELVQQAIGLDAGPGDRAWLHQLQGKALVLLGADQGALAAFDTAIALDKRATWAYFGKGRLLLRIGEYEGAAVAFEHMLDLDATSSLNALWAETGRLLVQESALLEVEVVDRPLLPGLDSAERHLDRADVLVELGAYPLAERDRRVALELEPDSADTLCALGQSYAQLESAVSPGEGRERLLHARSLGLLALPQAPKRALRARCHEVIGQASAALGERAQAIEHLEVAHHLQPENLRLRMWLERVSAGRMNRD